MTGLASTVSRRCGTDGGYRRHRRDGQPPCGACLRAHEARRLDEVLSGGMRVRGVESLPLEARRHAALVALGLIEDEFDPTRGRPGNSRGGRHVEFGVALGAGIPVTVVGPRENVFTWLPEVEHYDTWEDFIASIEVAA